eukprot:CFRG2299T1
MADAGWDQGETVYLGDGNIGNTDEASNSEIEEQFADFLRRFHQANEKVTYSYREVLRSQYNSSNYFLSVHMEHLRSASEWLAERVLNHPTKFLPVFEKAVKKVADEITRPRPNDEPIKDIQVMLTTDRRATTIRELDSTHVSKVVRVPGIVIKASNIVAKATNIRIECRNCGDVKDMSIRPGFSGAMLPRTCDRQPVEGEERCPLDPYDIMGDKCLCVDQQTLKLQEAPEMVPTGELPRHIMLSADRFLTRRVTPGSRVDVVGVFDNYRNSQSGASGKGDSGTVIPYIRVIGYMLEDDANSRSTSLTKEEEKQMIELSKDPELYEKIANSLAPEIYGSEDIKKSISCLLFGGSRKELPDGMRLRGDVNVLLLGDPGTAKSQLLKKVSKLAPVAVYTSGKGSSAAGLTASVVRDASSREFYLEAGAMVLADGGVVCIDEFDKMREEDRVAIHEAMEQQTISIAKAGITTILNTRTSVLAAANSTFGRWDDTKDTESNIDFQATILSRFDMIYIVKDVATEEQDTRIARHVTHFHQNITTKSEAAQGPIDADLLRKYINYARRHCGPRLNMEAKDRLINEFVNIRTTSKNTRRTIPITVRQLEAIIRISESLAKMRLMPFATYSNVEEALRLFRVSTLQAAQNGDITGMEGMGRDADQEEVLRAERRIQKRFPIGASVRERVILDDFASKDFSEYSVRKAIWIMLKRGDLEHRFQGPLLGVGKTRQQQRNGASSEGHDQSG